jgi:hypothetical protein
MLTLAMMKLSFLLKLFSGGRPERDKCPGPEGSTSLTQNSQQSVSLFPKINCCKDEHCQVDTRILKREETEAEKAQKKEDEEARKKADIIKIAGSTTIQAKLKEGVPSIVHIDLDGLRLPAQIKIIINSSENNGHNYKGNGIIDFAGYWDEVKFLVGGKPDFYSCRKDFNIHSVILFSFLERNI